MRPTLAALGLLAVAVAASATPAGIIEGPATAKDGDDVIVQSIDIRLQAVAAPEDSHIKRELGGPVATTSLAAIVAGGTAVIVPAGITFKCTPIAVWDGDGPIWCEEGPKIRIAGVAAREMNGSCRPNHPCPQVGAIDARDRLVRLFGGPKGKWRSGHIVVRSATMTCVSTGPADGSRTGAWCRSPIFGDLSCAVISAGGAVRWPRYWRNHRCE